MQTEGMKNSTLLSIAQMLMQKKSSISWQIIEFNQLNTIIDDNNNNKKLKMKPEKLTGDSLSFYTFGHLLIIQ